MQADDAAVFKACEIWQFFSNLSFPEEALLTIQG